MELRFFRYNLVLKHTFSIANYSRTTTPAVLTEIEHDGFIGYGEAALPQYLEETQTSVCEFLKKINLKQFSSPMQIGEILNYIDQIDTKNSAAKASLDIALHDLIGKINNTPIHQYFGANVNKTPPTSYTIGIDTEKVIRQKVKEAEPYSILKIKVGKENWRELVRIIRQMTNKPLYIDANQSWTDCKEALDNVLELQTQNVKLIEQPMPKTNLDDHAWLTERSPLPIIADESVLRLTDIDKIKGAFSGINIKLMKCTGLYEAYLMIKKARKENLKIMLGCMTETSCGISAAAQLSPLVDFADLDGNLLITNDCFEGVKIKNGRIALSDSPGIGIQKRD